MAVKKTKKKVARKPILSAKDRKKIQQLYSKWIAEEIATGKYPRKQAIAIGISRANRSLRKTKKGSRK